jgi:hypothetical protein
MCEVARNSPEGEKSIDSGAYLNYTQSTKQPVTMSQILTDLSIDEQSNHFESGLEKHMSVIRF